MRIRNGTSAALLIAGTLLFGSRSATRGQPPEQPPPVNVPKLIDDLVNVVDQDIGYSASLVGTSFVPLDRKATIHGGLLLQKPLARSETMRRIVCDGTRALPHLIDHLNDRRPTKIRIQGGLGLFIGSDIEQNPRTDKLIDPVKHDDENPKHNDRFHQLTVADLCFVAIGQIVNRQYNAVEYIPSAIVSVNTPTRSADMRAKAKQLWGELTPQRHRDALIDDFLKPDSSERRIGACKRLAYYYPEALEPIVLRLLREPAYDVTIVQDFLSEKLYTAKSTKEAKELLDAFSKQHGEVWKEGVLHELFGNLDAPATHDRSRTLLIDLFGRNKDVKASDQPKWPPLTTTAIAELIEQGLIYDQIDKIDRAVLDLMRSTADHDLANQCVWRLIGRGFDNEIEAYCKRRLVKTSNERELGTTKKALDRLGWTRLHVAVERGDLDAVKKLVKDRRNVNATARVGTTPLHVAVAANDLPVVEALVSAGAELERTNQTGLTAAQIAIRGDMLPIAELLGKKGCVAPDLLLAAFLGRTEELERHLKRNAGSIRMTTQEEKQSALHLAAIGRHGPIARALLAAGAPVESENEWGMTPLHLAAAFDAVEVIRELVAKKASVRAVARNPPAEPLHLAAANGRVAAVEELTRLQVPVDAPFGPGMTSLHIAAERDFVTVMDLLLKHGAKVNGATDSGVTPLHFAAANGRVEAAKRLLAAKAEVDATDRKMRTPLHVAAMNGQTAMIRVLLDHRADPLAKDKDDAMAKDLAAFEGHKEAVELLTKAMKK